MRVLRKKRRGGHSLTKKKKKCKCPKKGKSTTSKSLWSQAKRFAGNKQNQRFALNVAKTIPGYGGVLSAFSNY